MCIKKSQILELNDIILHLNSIDDDYEKEAYLQETVEDIELFMSTLRSVNKNKLVRPKRKKAVYIKSNNYTSDIIQKIFEENTLDEIVSKYTKRELTDMYITISGSKPLSASDKMRIAQNIYHHFYTIKRTKALLG